MVGYAGFGVAPARAVAHGPFAVPTTALALSLVSEHRPRVPALQTHDAAGAFLTAKTAARSSPRTITAYRDTLARFARVVPDLPCQAEDVERFLLTLQGYKPSTIHHHWRTTRNFLRWCARRYRLPDPTGDVEAPRYQRGLPDPLDPDELERLLLHPSHSERDRVLLFVLAESGMRAGEAASMRKPGLHDTYVEVDGKVGPRAVPISPVVMEMVKALWAPGDYVWWGRKGPLGVEGVKDAVRQAMKRAGLHKRHMGPHTLRHTLGTLWTGSEADLQVVGGWKTLKALELYRGLRMVRAQAQQIEHSPVQRMLRAQKTKPTRKDAPNMPPPAEHNPDA